MNSESLKKALVAKHEELTRSPALDERSRRVLREMMRDLEKLPQSLPVAPASLSKDRLEKLAISFEVEHPTLAAALREFAELLAAAGL